jgi:hypothetical protein
VFTRFKISPSHIIYDNACNAHLYCMLREPYWFRMTRFIIDRFHKLGHSACCSPAFDPYLHQDIVGVNTSGVEQVNSWIDDLGKQVKYMLPSPIYSFFVISLFVII